MKRYKVRCRQWERYLNQSCDLEARGSEIRFSAYGFNRYLLLRRQRAVSKRTARRFKR